MPGVCNHYFQFFKIFSFSNALSPTPPVPICNVVLSIITIFSSCDWFFTFSTHYYNIIATLIILLFYLFFNFIFIAVNRLKKKNSHYAFNGTRGVTVTRGHNTHVHIHTRTRDENIDENGSKTTNFEQQHIVAKEDRVSPIMSNNSQKLPTTERVIKSEWSQTYYHCINILHSSNFCFLFVLMIVPFLSCSSSLPPVSHSCRSRGYL